MTDVRWEGLTHTEIYQRVHAGPGRTASTAVESAWADTEAVIVGIEERLAVAVRQAGGGWEGQAADATRVGITPLGQWAADAAGDARLTAAGITAQGEQAAWLRNTMPSPSAPPWGERPAAPGADPLYLPADPQALQQRNTADAAQAVHLMNTYSANAFDNIRLMNFWTLPPAVTVEAAPAPAAAAAGAPFLAAPTGSPVPGAGPAQGGPVGGGPMAGAGGPTAGGGGSITGGAPAVVPGGVLAPAGGPPVAGGGSPGPVGRAGGGPGGSRGGAVPGSAGRPGSRVGAGTPTGRAGSTPGGRTAPPGRAPSASAPSASAPSPSAPSPSAPSGSATGSTRPALPGRTAPGVDERGPHPGTGSGPGRSSSMLPGPPGRVPVGDGMAPRPGAGGVEPGPGRAAPGEPTRGGAGGGVDEPARGGAPAGQRAATAPAHGGLYPPMYAAGTGPPDAEHRRPDYLLDDGDAFADHRWFPPPVIGADDEPPPARW